MGGPYIFSKIQIQDTVLGILIVPVMDAEMIVLNI
ncbi:hypothetical protein Godav_025805 [Gossypium davidsonii]|uniref:Uncharacterized protein n=1 Tax=Gossypium davidsonii TaxID=34287 RepID=A0A7J8TFX8_GOSDV|nr:hypothetical protein [Gossypium davidsonii]